jgi:tRNA1(Val) A37 N6-methylase TrmN6
MPIEQAWLGDVLQVRGRDWMKLGEKRRQLLIGLAFEYWRKQGFPYYRLSESEIVREFRNVQAQPAAVDPAGVRGSNVGLRLANFFQPQMWSVRVSRYRSPMDVFLDNDLLPLAIRRAWSVWPDRFGANAATLRRMLKTFPSTASVSNFRPTVARAVFAAYSSAGDTVVDFAAGYGGRLLGALSLDRHYVGIEPCKGQVAGLRRTVQTLSGLKLSSPSAEVVAGCAEESLKLLPRAQARLVFSSPPYYDWEKYSTEANQSFVRYSSYSEWVNSFLEPVIRLSHRALHRNGYLVMNISGRARRPKAEEVISIAATVGFRYRATIPLLLARVPYLHPRSAGPKKQELLLVMEKSN